MILNMRELLQFRFYSPEFILFNIYISSHANEIRKKGPKDGCEERCDGPERKTT
jgi:hypothetical protein